LVVNDGIPIKEAARTLRINYGSARRIISEFKKINRAENDVTNLENGQTRLKRGHRPKITDEYAGKLNVVLKQTQ
jgi:hypothetical protein